MAITLEELCSTWLADYSKNTRRTYAPAIAAFVEQLEDLNALSTLTPETLQAIIPQPYGATGTQRTYKIAIRSFLKFAGAQGHCPATLYDSIHIEWQKAASLVTTYFDRRLDAVINTETDANTEINARNRVILGLTLAAGCSIAELIKLTWYDVDLSQFEITLHPSQEESRKLHFQDPNDSIWIGLIALRNDRSIDDFVFHGKQKKGLNFNQVREVIEVALKRAGIKASVGEVCKTSAQTKRKYLLR